MRSRLPSQSKAIVIVSIWSMPYMFANHTPLVQAACRHTHKSRHGQNSRESVDRSEGKKFECREIPVLIQSIEEL